MEIYDFTVLEDNIQGFDPSDFTFNQKVQLLKAYNEGLSTKDLNLLIKSFNGNTRSSEELKELIAILRLNVHSDIRDEILNRKIRLEELREIKKMIKRKVPKYKILESIHYEFNAEALYKVRQYWELNNAKKPRSR